MRTVQSRTVTKITRVGSATDTRSDRSEFVFRPVPCKRMKRNVYMGSDTNSYRSEFVPVPCNYPLTLDLMVCRCARMKRKGTIFPDPSFYRRIPSPPFCTCLVPHHLNALSRLMHRFPSYRCYAAGKMARHLFRQERII